MAFEWIVLNGSCAVCLALAGYHDEEPARPHQSCDCDIFESEPGYPPGTCWIDLETNDLYVDGDVVMDIEISKICSDGEEVSTTFQMEQTFDEWYAAWFEDPPNGEEWAAWHDELHARIAATCAGELEDMCTEFVVPTPP